MAGQAKHQGQQGVDQVRLVPGAGKRGSSSFFHLVGGGHEFDRSDAFVDRNLRESMARCGIVQEKEYAMLSGVTSELKALI